MSEDDPAVPTGTALMGHLEPVFLERPNAYLDMLRSREAGAPNRMFDRVVLTRAVDVDAVMYNRNLGPDPRGATESGRDLEFTEQAADGHHQYVEWKAHAFGGKGLSGITVITRNAAGAITHLAAHHRPLGEALKFSAEIGRRLQGVIDASHFLQAEDPSRTE